MESPFYEMTHDIQREYEIESKAYQTGYSRGFMDGSEKTIERLVSMSDSDLLKWKKQQIDIKDVFLKRSMLQK